VLHVQLSGLVVLARLGLLFLTLSLRIKSVLKPQCFQATKHRAVDGRHLACLGKTIKNDRDEQGYENSKHIQLEFDSQGMEGSALHDIGT
jgi:hypothetical protein